MSWGVNAEMGDFSDKEPEYKIEKRSGCTVIWGSIPLEDMISLSIKEPSEVIMSTDLPSKMGASFVFGTRENLEALAKDPDLPICPVRLEEAERARKKGLPESFVDWLVDGDRGMSSNAIAQKVTGVITSREYIAHPLDTSDFGRCLGVIDALISDSMSEKDIVKQMVGLTPTWTRLAWQWFEIKKYYDERDGKAVYDLLQEV